MDHFERLEKETKEFLSKLNDTLPEYKKLREEVVRLLKQKKIEEAKKILKSGLQYILKDLQKSSDLLVQTVATLDFVAEALIKQYEKEEDEDWGIEEVE